MRKIAPLIFKFVYLETPGSISIVNNAYRRIFAIAKRNVLAKRSVNVKGGEDHENKKD